MEEPAAARARSCGFAVWLHGLGDCGRANESIADHFSAAAFANTRWAFPTAPTSPVTCNRGTLMPSWFDIHDTPITSKSVKDEEDVLRAVQSVHAIIDREIAAGTDPEDVFVFGLSQGGALSIASVLLYPKTLGGCAVFSGFLPFSSSFASRVTAEAKKTPVLWVHGGADSLVPTEAGRDGVEFLRGLAMSCEFKVYESLGHTLEPFELEYCERWASENILKEHREGLNQKKGGGSRCWFFGGVINCFSKYAVLGWRRLPRRAASCCGFTAPAGRGEPPQVAPYFAAPEIASSVRLSFPTAPTTAVACYCDEAITAWFGISQVPITAKTVRDEREVLKAVEHVHELLDTEIAAGTDPANIFVCGMSQGGALAIASVLLYPKTLGGCVVFSGSVPMSKSFAEKVPPEARKTPVLWFHGMADGLVLFEAGHAGCAFLEELGMSCEFKAYPTLGHSIIDEELQYLQQWITDRLGISEGTETARPSSSPHHKDPQ